MFTAIPTNRPKNFAQSKSPFAIVFDVCDEEDVVVDFDFEALLLLVVVDVDVVVVFNLVSGFV